MAEDRVAVANSGRRERLDDVGSFERATSSAQPSPASRAASSTPLPRASPATPATPGGRCLSTRPRCPGQFSLNGHSTPPRIRKTSVFVHWTWTSLGSACGSQSCNRNKSASRWNFAAQLMYCMGRYRPKPAASLERLRKTARARDSGPAERIPRRSDAPPFPRIPQSRGRLDGAQQDAGQLNVARQAAPGSAGFPSAFVTAVRPSVFADTVKQPLGRPLRCFHVPHWSTIVPHPSDLRSRSRSYGSGGFSRIQGMFANQPDASCWPSAQSRFLRAASTQATSSNTMPACASAHAVRVL